MEIRTQVSTRVTYEHTTTESVLIAPGVEAQRITVVFQTEGKPDTRSVQERVELVERPSSGFDQLSVVEPELLERLHLNGWFTGAQDGELISRTPFTRVLDGRPYEVVRIRAPHKAIYDLQGQRLPVGQIYTYITGGVNSSNFDLNALLCHLQGREDVTIHPAPPRYCPSDPPLYCVGGPDDWGLSFTWHPDAQLFRRYCELSANLDYFGKAAVAHQLMGNDPFRISK